MAFQNGSHHQPLHLKGDWAGFDLVKVGAQVPLTYFKGEIFVVSGCITTTTPAKNQAGWALTIGNTDPRCAPSRDITFLAPTAMSRYEGIYQCGTSVTLKCDGRLQIIFNKNTNPMVLHLSSLCCYTGREEAIEIPVFKYGKQEWNTARKFRDDKAFEDVPPSLESNEDRPPALQRIGHLIFLQGELKEATFGPISQLVGEIPAGLRPKRELRFLASLLKVEDDRSLEHSIALTIRTDGNISVQGGQVHMMDSKGHMKIVQMNKKGCLCLDGIRYSLTDGIPLTLTKHVLQDVCRVPKKTAASKLDYLRGDANSCNATCIKHDDLVVLEGHLSWTGTRNVNTKQPLSILPPSHWPRRREVFLTRGGSDKEERRRVDVDQWGRIFCPEGVCDERVELTGIIFVASDSPPSVHPRDPDWDDLKLHYQRNDVNVTSTTFDGHELLEQFVRRSNYHEWKFIEYDFARHAGRKMLLPLGQIPLRGNEKWDPMNLESDRALRLWQDHKAALAEHYGITCFYTLLHVSQDMLQRICKKVKMQKDNRWYLEEIRKNYRLRWACTRKANLDYNCLESIALEITNQMFEHWDFKGQLQGALQNDFRPPATIEHLFPTKRCGHDHYIRKYIKDAEMSKFEEIQQFFYLYETTGANMSHCSLLGASDMFTSTGKWHFPDAPDVQKQLFEHIAWLFPRKVYLYMSERQTQIFPFIEDFDVQAPFDWECPGTNGTSPPDELIMTRPIREGNRVFGDPGELMQHRARAIHMTYPHLDHLEVLVYSASGVNKGKGMLKSSFHLVWPQLIVDPDRAPVIRHVTLGLFWKETMIPNSYLSQCQQRLLELHESNSWELVFDSTTINARNGLRLPYNDKASMVVESEEDKRKIKEGLLSKTKAYKKRVREDRPSVAVGKIRFEFDKDPTTGESRLTSSQWVADVQSYSTAQWIGFGTCRRDPNSVVQTELTPWQLGQEVLEMLPRKAGEEFYRLKEGQDDGEGGHWVTHKPFTQIRRSYLSTDEFQKQFSDALDQEWECLREEQQHDLFRRCMGSWISVTPDQAIWKANAESQGEFPIPDRVWHCSDSPRPAELVYVMKKGKVIVDGAPDVVEALLRALRNFTRPDDNAIMPIYDVTKISR